MTLSQHVIPNVHTCGEFQSCPCGECMGSVNTNSSTFPIIAQYHMKSRTTICAIWHDEKLQQFAENPLYIYIWPYLKKNRFPTSVTLSKHVISNLYLFLSSINWTHHFSFIFSEMMTNQAWSSLASTKIEQGWLYWRKHCFFCNIAQCQSDPWMTLILFKTRLDTFIFHLSSPEC